MGDSTDSEEFFDAEEFTPIKGSKHSSVTSSTTVPEKTDLKETKESTKDSSLKPESNPSASNHSVLELQISTEEDRANVKNVVQDRHRFQELRRCMQTEDDDDVLDPMGSTDQQSLNMERPFKIIAHDTMSLQSMTSLGRIGRILGGTSESHRSDRSPNILESSIPPRPLSSREPSIQSEDPLPSDRNQTVLAMAEPDVIASTKANSLKNSRGYSGAVVSVASQSRPESSVVPKAPPRRKKRNKLYGSQSLSTTDGDNLSICTNDTDDYRYMLLQKPDKPIMLPLDSLLHEPSLSNMLAEQSMALPSPASTIESLTREFQDSLELSQTKYEESRRDSEKISYVSSRSSTGKSTKSLSGKREEMRIERGTARTHSDTRPANSSSLGQSRSSEPEGAAALTGERSRRRSAGDEQITANKPRATNSQLKLTDMEILEQVTVLNLDTGEKVPLSIAEHKIPQCINPLSLHIMRLTSEYLPNDDENTSEIPAMPPSWALRISRKLSISTFNLTKRPSLSRTAISIQSLDSARNRETDEESESVCAGGAEDDAKEIKQESSDKNTGAAIKRKTEKCDLIENIHIPAGNPDVEKMPIIPQYEHPNVRLKRFFGSTVKKTVDAAKSLAQEVSHARHKEDVSDIADDVRGEHNIKLKASNSHKGPYDFDGCVRHVQEMGEAHSGPVWCCKFSVCGRLLATAGQDKLLRIWVTRDAYDTLQDMRTKYANKAKQKSSPTPSQESLASLSSPPPSPEDKPLGPAAPFCPKPFCVYSGHTSDLLDVSWSKNSFILSSSMDKTVRLWHISRAECLCCFQHIDFVTAIVFHPRDDRYFLSGSLDGKIRLWNIPDKKVAVWNQVGGKTKLITAANFCQNGKFAVIGTYDGRCIFYTTDQLKYHTLIDVRSSRGKNAIGRKISGIEPMPGEDKILVTSNDSRIRLYDLRDLNLSCKYKGYVNVSSQIKASFSHDGKYIVSGSENQCIYIWKTYHDYSKFTSVRRDRNDFWEGIKAHNAVVTCAVFAPNPDHMIRMIGEREEEAKLANKERNEKEDDVQQKSSEGSMVSSSQTGHILVSTDYNGCIKVFVHKAKPKHSSLPASALA